MQRIAVIGGTGMTGQCVVDYALQKGLKVRLLYRNESTIPERFKGKVELVQGDALNIDDCKRVVDGVDACCITLGTRNNLEPTKSLSDGTKNLIEAMKEKNVKRFSIIMSSFLFRPITEVPPPFKNLNEEHQRMLDLTKASGLDYVAILPPHIADEPSGEFTVLHDATPGRAVSKYDLAKFIVDSLEDDKHLRKVCGIAKKA